MGMKSSYCLIYSKPFIFQAFFCFKRNFPERVALDMLGANQKGILGEHHALVCAIFLRFDYLKIEHETSFPGGLAL